MIMFFIKGLVYVQVRMVNKVVLKLIVLNFVIKNKNERVSLVVQV